MGLWNWIKENAGKIAGVAVGVALAPVTGGVSLVACGGIGFLVGSAIDNDISKRQNEDKLLNMKGKISEEIRGEINKVQDERSREASNLNNLDQQLAQKQSKLNDPNVPESEKAQIRSEIATLINQRGAAEERIKALDKKIETLLKNAQQTVTGQKGGLINLEAMDQQTKLIIMAIIILVIYFAFIKENNKG